MSLKSVAREVLRICEDGSYVSESGVEVDLGDALANAIQGTRVLSAGEAIGSGSAASGSAAEGPCTVEVTDERTQVAAARLCHDEGVIDPALLNFASAKNPGGGFINGAKAQEEDLARCSGLYACLREQMDHYRDQRAVESMLYTDAMIYSPRIPFFRSRSRGALMDVPFLASVVSAPAPNAGEALRRDAHAHKAIEDALRRRARRVLSICTAYNHRVLVLGAWGCGVFQNDPALVADAFGTWLEDDEFQGRFERVVFAIYDRRKGAPVLKAFQERFG